MTILELRDRLITDGIASVKRYEKRPERLRGGLAGFELCRALIKPEEFLAVLDERHHEERRRLVADEKDGYWEYRTATAQVEFVWERIKAALRIGQTFSGNAVMHVHRLLEEEARKTA